MNDGARNAILVVDDDLDVRETIALLLNEHGYETFICSSAEAAMALLQKNSFDVVLTDIRMPLVTGIELLERIHMP